MNLSDAYFVLVGILTRRVVVLTYDARCLSIMTTLHYAIVHYVKHVVEKDFAVNLSDDVVLHKHEAIDFNVDSESISVETRANLFVYFYENVIGGFLNTSLRVFLGNRINKL